MPRSRAHRRYHTHRVAQNRRRRYLAVTPWWIRSSWPEREMPDGRLSDRDAYHGGCGPRCYLCHWDKLDPSRRAREARAWEREVDEQLAAM